MYKQYLLVVCAIISLTNAASPKFITKCKTEDSKCAQQSAQVALPIFAQGLSEYNVQVLDPAVFQKVDASTPNLEFVLNNVTITGWRNCKITKVRRDAAHSKMDLRFLCVAKLDGNYLLKGKILLLPVEGNGKIHVDLKTTQINLALNIENIKGDDGKIHWHIKSWNHSFTLLDKSDVKFENLFENNEVLARAANELIASSGNDIIVEIGAPVIKAAVDRVVENCEQFFKAIPVEDLSID